MSKQRAAQGRHREGHAAARRTSTRWWVLPGMLATAGAAIAAIALLSAARPAPVPASSAPAAAGSPGLSLGSAGAAVELHEYGDFQCTSCGAFFRASEPKIVAAYVDTGRVRLVWHDFPWIGPESLDAANAARCAADQGRFWDYHDLLYQSQGAENSGAFSASRLKDLGSQLGLDAARFDACVDAGAHLAAVRADLATASSSGFPGTPTFILGTQRIVGAQPYQVFQQALDAALGR